MNNFQIVQIRLLSKSTSSVFNPHNPLFKGEWTMSSRHYIQHLIQSGAKGDSLLRLIYLLFIFFVLVLSSCGKKDGNTSSETIDISANPHTEVITLTQEQFTTSNMQLGSFEQRSFASKVKANGYIDVPPEYKASVSVKLGGFVKALSILPGGKIMQGALLFTLENPDYIQLQQDYLEAKAQLAYLQSDFERQKSLADENITSQKNFLKAESDFKVTQARVAGLKEKLKLLNINLSVLDAGTIEPVVKVLSPLTGFISKVNITRGVFVSPADVAVEIVSTEHMHVELQAFERDVPFIKENQVITFNVSGAPSVKYMGEVYLIGKTVEGDTRTVNIHGHIDDEDKLKNILPGMYVEATIEVESSMHTVLPTNAVVTVEDNSYVLLMSKQHNRGYEFKKVKVHVGRFNNEWTEIINAAAFKADDVFLVKGAFNLILE
jgi:membrane fusion protein, heavy metal efflux system